MAGDINLHEQVVILPAEDEVSARSLTRSVSRVGGRMMHQYGPRVQIVELPRGADQALSRAMPARLRQMAPAAPSIQIPEDLDEVGRYGLQALQMRESPEFVQAKANRPHGEKSWHEGGTEALQCTDHAVTREEARALAATSTTSGRLTGSVAVGLIIVEGPTKALQFSEEERAKVVAEVQNGLGWLGSQNPAAAVVWKYDIQVIRITTKPGADNLSFGAKEARWRDPVMKKMGYGTGMTAVRKYIEDIRTRLQTEWTYCAFFTKYPVGHFAYASIGGPRLVMHYDNDGWGPNNIDRVFTHETGHIFGAPDEYGGSGCNTNGKWGVYGKPNDNCENGNPNSVDCIMKGNTWNMCAHTPYHLGFPIDEQRYSGVWRAGSDKHGLWVNATWNSFFNKWKEWGQQNLLLTDLKITNESDGRRYHGVWREGRGGYALWVNATWNNFLSKWREWGNQGLRLIDLEIIPGNRNLYSGVWTSGTDGYGLWVNADWNSFRSKWQEWGKKGLRLIDLKVVNDNGRLRYSGVWRAGSGKYALWVNASWDSFKTKWEDWAKKGYRLIDLEVLIINGERRYFGVWGAGNDAYGLWVNADWNSFEAKWKEWAKKGYRLIDLDVYTPGNVNSPLPSDSLVLSMPTKADSLSGTGFLSSEHLDDTVETDLETGALVMGTTEPTEAAAPTFVPAFGPEDTAPSLPEEEGLGGMAGAPAFSSEAEDGFGGAGGDEPPAGSEEGGLGGLVV